MPPLSVKRAKERLSSEFQSYPVQSRNESVTSSSSSSYDDNSSDYSDSSNEDLDVVNVTGPSCEQKKKEACKPNFLATSTPEEKQTKKTVRQLTIPEIFNQLKVNHSTTDTLNENKQDGRDDNREQLSELESREESEDSSLLSSDFSDSDDSDFSLQDLDVVNVTTMSDSEQKMKPASTTTTPKLKKPLGNSKKSIVNFSKKDSQVDTREKKYQRNCKKTIVYRESDESDLSDSSSDSTSSTVKKRKNRESVSNVNLMSEKTSTVKDFEQDVVPSPVFDKKTIVEVCKRFQRGDTATSISKEFKISTQTLGKWRRR